MLLGEGINSFFANKDDVENGNGNRDDDEEMDICIEADSTHNLCNKFTKIV